MSRFITIEGPDGSGKSSVLNELKKILGENWFYTKEPGSPHNKICVSIREMLLNPENDIDGEAEIFLYLADRCQHVQKVIKPQLDSGKNVFCDRYRDSTFAYQCFGIRQGTQEAIAKINTLNDFATFKLMPETTIILTVDPKVGLSRIKKEEFGTADRIEQRKTDFHQRVCEGYKYLIDNEKNRDFIVIDTTHTSKEETLSIVINELNVRGIL